MCGIVGYIGTNNAVDVVMRGLEHLEYRGYDSAGLAIRKNTNHGVTIKKAVGKLSALKDLIKNDNMVANSGMGHTRWATHGVPSLENAHPHRYGRVSLVHNGILENHQVIKQKLEARGHQFCSTTDTEVAAHLLDSFLQDGKQPLEAISMLCDTVHGAYAFGIMLDNDDSRLYFAKLGSPLIVAYGDDGSFFASDQAALVDHQPVYCSLDDGDIGFISPDGVQVFDLKCHKKSVSWSKLTAQKEAVQKTGHKHFMHKEIFEQSETIARVLRGRLDEQGINLDGCSLDFDRIIAAKKIDIIACGSSYLAGLIIKPQLESLLKVPVNVEIASEYRYRNTLTDAETLVIAISQSGETVDTLAALKKALEHKAMCMSVCNVLGSAIASACETSLGNLFLYAGPEISVASTKAFIAQLVALKLFTYSVAKKLGRLGREEESGLMAQFKTLQHNVTSILARDEEIRALASTLIDEKRMLYLGRSEMFPVALEGALKMKELSYIFAEGYPAGELKHGPIATIEPGMPVVIIFGTELVSKTASNLQEVKARGAKIISILPKGISGVKEESDQWIELDACHPSLEPILAAIPLQLLAYHLSDLKGIDVDKPRNLAKSVTVE
jgi:glutamine---fructose-6-phosphate transaminase (isomerizing)